jgi:hypothetical protein
MIKTEDGRVEIKGDYVDLISDFGCIARSIGRNLEKRGYPQKLIEAKLHQMVDMTFKSLEEIRMQTVVESIIQGALKND